MFMRFILALVLITGCNAFPVQTRCETDFVAEFTAEGKIDCNIAIYNLNFARELEIQSGLTTSEEWNRIYKDTAIWVSDSAGVPDQIGHDHLNGFYDDFRNQIQVGTDYHSLLHELLHRYQSEHGEYDTTFHINWDKNGFNDLIAVYLKERHVE